ncbi:hypothetical protein K0U73_18265 [bacterium]|nr:hypothetical protein [Acidimicrobiaceae bacterium]MCH9805734.1 hypothetical protein [bacterium]
MARTWPSIARSPMTKPETWHAAHLAADEAGLHGYFDPETGLFVMTEGYHRRRGHCCNSACRHCPYR